MHDLDPAELAHWNARNKKARDEYRRHPFERVKHGPACAAWGCPTGYSAATRMSTASLRARAKRRAQR